MQQYAGHPRQYGERLIAPGAAPTEALLAARRIDGVVRGAQQDQE
jgi:hypothetical protein